MNWLGLQVCELGRPLWWVVGYRIQILNIVEQSNVNGLLLCMNTTILGLKCFWFCLFNDYLFEVVKLKMINFSADHFFSFHIHAFYLRSGKGYTSCCKTAPQRNFLENGL